MRPIPADHYVAFMEALRAIRDAVRPEATAGADAASSLERSAGSQEDQVTQGSEK